MLAVETHRTSAIAAKIRKTAVIEFQLNVDTILLGPATSHSGSNPGQVVADIHRLDAPLGLIDAFSVADRLK